MFYFKLVDGDGAVLLQSVGFHRPDEVGSAIARLMALLGQVAVDSAMLAMDGRIEVAGSVEAVQQALAMLEEIENRKRAAKDAQARAL